MSGDHNDHARQPSRVRIAPGVRLVRFRGNDRGAVEQLMRNVAGSLSGRYRVGLLEGAPGREPSRAASVASAETAASAPAAVGYAGETTGSPFAAHLAAAGSLTYDTASFADPVLENAAWESVDFVFSLGAAEEARPAVVVDDDGAATFHARGRTTRTGNAMKTHAKIAAEIVAFFTDPALIPPLYGLVLCGGRSERMRQEKGAIAYHDLPQARHAYALLRACCTEVFLSIRPDQSDDPVYGGLPQIHDRFTGIGPAGGILSAFAAHPDAAFLVLGCDLPFVSARTLTSLVDERDPLRAATCYDSASEGLPEPMCAIFEPAFRARMFHFLAAGRDCPRKALINSYVKRLAPPPDGALENVNDPGARDAAFTRIDRTERVSR